MIINFSKILLDPISRKTLEKQINHLARLRYSVVVVTNRAGAPNQK